MADIELVIKLPEDTYKDVIKNGFIYDEDSEAISHAIINGILLPKGHEDIFDKDEILRFLKCLEYETCDWKNCSECNRSRCINLNNVNNLVPIIEADKVENEVTK